VGAGVLAFLTLVPMPFHAVHQGVVWLPDEAIVRAPVPGHVRDVRVQVGSAVQAGQPLLQLDSPELLADLGDAAGGVAQTAAALRQAEFDAPAQAVALRKELDARQHRLDEADRRVRQLDVAAGVSGRWVPAQALALEGQHVHRGDVIGYVVDGPARLVRVAVTQDDLDLIRSRLTQVDVRLARDVHQDLSGRLRRQVPGGEFDLVSPALGTVGGGEIAVDPGQNEGRQSLQRVFDLEVALDRPTSLPVFGDRAYVRFDLGATPLLWQWGLRLRQLFLARLAV
jgi:putative peptide zinc metalloprotease protein